MVELGSTSLTIVGVIAAIAVVSLIIAVVLRRQVLAAGEGTEKMQDIAKAVQEGASAYLSRQFRTLAVFAVVVCGLLFLLPGDSGVKVGRSIFFLVGAVFSATIGYLGMWLATRANLRVAAAASQPGGRAEGARIAFRTGGFVGMSVVGLGLLGASSVVLIYKEQAPAVLEGFGFGAALLAMFMRVGGGIFTKAADVGADLVGKVEQGIPEDDPRNAATIADNVGDNVGDCAGMAADLFESYAVTLVAALILGKVAFGEQGLVFPLIVTAMGAIVAVLGVLITRVRGSESGLTAINRGLLHLRAGRRRALRDRRLRLPAGHVRRLRRRHARPRTPATRGSSPRSRSRSASSWPASSCGSPATSRARRASRRCTSHAPRSPARRQSSCRASGSASSRPSTPPASSRRRSAASSCSPAARSRWRCSSSRVAGCGLLTTVGVIVAMDTFGPVSDNAQGIAEMSGDVTPEGAQILTDLDAVGNTTKAVTKGIAIATAVLAATALFGSYQEAVLTAIGKALPDWKSGAPVPGSDIIQSMVNYQIISPVTLVGVILGGATVFLFSGLAIDAVTRAAGAIVFEVRRQFRENPGIMTYEVRPEYGRVVDICTRDSLRELATPGLLAAFAPIAVGFGLGVGPLAGFLGGAIGTGVLMAVFLANSGGAWDNAKKIVEDGNFGGKGSDAHAAAVIGDTVGDPFKDTAGPAINPLIKVMNLVALLIAPAVVSVTLGHERQHRAADRDRGRGRAHRVRGRHRVPRAGGARRQGRPDPRGREAAGRLTRGARPGRVGRGVARVAPCA